MNLIHCKRLVGPLLAVAVAHGALDRRLPPVNRSPDESHSYTVFIQSRPIGQEVVAVVREGTGWVVRGGNRLAPPLDVVLRTAEIHYDEAWRPTSAAARRHEQAVRNSG